MDARRPLQKATLRGMVVTCKRRHRDMVVRGHNQWPGVAMACAFLVVSEWLKTKGLCQVGELPGRGLGLP